KTIDETKRLREGRAPFEKQTRPIRWQLVKERIERPADPEVFLDVLFRRPHPPSRRGEQRPAVRLRRGDHATVLGVHAGDREGFDGCRWVARWETLDCRRGIRWFVSRSSLTTDCIQIGNVGRPCCRSARIASPWAGSCKMCRSCAMMLGRSDSNMSCSQ